MRVLYLHPAGAYGGASKSLIELFQLLRNTGVAGTVLTPTGSATQAFADAGMSVIAVKGLSQFDNTRYGHYRRLRWLILLRELFLLPGSLLAIWRLRGEHFDILHVNEITLLPLGILAKKLLGLPMVVHVRSLQRPPESSWRSRLINHWLGRYANAVVAIDAVVAKMLDPALPLNIVHNGLRVDTVVKQDIAYTPKRLPVRVGFMGVLAVMKGVYELIEAMRILKDRRVGIECVVVGENTRELRGVVAWALRKLDFAKDVRTELEQLTHQYGLENHVHLLGLVKDVRTIYPTLDILCFPSHLDAAGRPVFEAAFYSVPSVVAIQAPPPDAVLHEVTGLAIPRPEPELIANALQRLAEDGPFRQTLGRQAQEWAVSNFSIENSATAMTKIYRQLMHHSERK
ncbi:MAG: glycosyltransferase family 4 protein [Pseudomonadota bacterium]